MRPLASREGSSHGVYGEPITSTQNALVKRAASLQQHKFRRRHNAFLVEGVDLVAAGLVAGQRPQAIFVQAEDAGVPELRELPLGGASFPVAVVTRRVAAHISSLETPPAVMAVFPLLVPPPLVALSSTHTLGLYADRVADPGNLGTLVRAAAAFGATCVLTSPESADLFAPKVVRASMGAVFGVPLYSGWTLSRALEELASARVYGLVAHGGADPGAVPLCRPALVCVGAERVGLSPAVLEMVDQPLTIPLAGAVAGVESLNAGVAGAIALYEFSRRTGGIPTAGR